MTGDQLFEESREEQRAREAARAYFLHTRTLPMCDSCGAQGGVQVVTSDGRSHCSPSCDYQRAGGNGGNGTVPTAKPLSRPDVFQSVETQAIVALAQAAHDLDRIIKLLGGK